MQNPFDEPGDLEREITPTGVIHGRNSGDASKDRNNDYVSPNPPLPPTRLASSELPPRPVKMGSMEDHIALFTRQQAEDSAVDEWVDRTTTVDSQDVSQQESSIGAANPDAFDLTRAPAPSEDDSLGVSTMPTSQQLPVPTVPQPPVQPTQAAPEPESSTPPELLGVDDIQELRSEVSDSNLQQGAQPSVSTPPELSDLDEIQKLRSEVSDTNLQQGAEPSISTPPEVSDLDEVQKLRSEGSDANLQQGPEPSISTPPEVSDLDEVQKLRSQVSDGSLQQGAEPSISTPPELSDLDEIQKIRSQVSDTSAPSTMDPERLPAAERVSRPVAMGSNGPIEDCANVAYFPGGSDAADPPKEDGARLWELAAASSEPASLPGVSNLVQAIEANGGTRTASNEVSTASTSCHVTASTPGGSTFETLRAPSPDAHHIAMAKSDDFQPSKTFINEDDGRNWSSAGASRNRLVEEIKKHTQSRANPRAKVQNTPKKMVSMDGMDDLAEDEVFKFKGDHTAQRHRRMVELLVVGCLATLFGWMGNLFIAESCYFASAPTEIGAYNAEFEMRFGIWKYSPPDSILGGYTYCKSYGDYHAEESPIAARIFQVASLAAGSFSLAVLWYFLATGFSSPLYWTAAIFVSVVAAVFQVLTLVFYWGALCHNMSCQWGLSSSIVPVASFAWILLALEMRYQAPFVKTDKTKEGSIEMSAVKSKEASYYKPPTFVSHCVS